MGHARKLEDDNPPSSPLNETLLIATMCIVGLQVHVHVKDGSVFSGVFYTASFENGFGTSIEFLNLILCVCCYNNARSLEI